MPNHYHIDVASVSDYISDLERDRKEMVRAHRDLVRKARKAHGGWDDANYDRFTEASEQVSKVFDKMADALEQSTKDLEKMNDAYGAYLNRRRRI